MAQPDWRSPAAYEALRPADAPGLAWEFLSRNAAFERERTRLEQAAERGHPQRRRPRRSARRWGERFRASKR
jgi:hypothetical protein